MQVILPARPEARAGTDIFFNYFSVLRTFLTPPERKALMSNAFYICFGNGIPLDSGL